MNIDSKRPSTNKEFLDAIFVQSDADNRPMVLSFPGKPSEHHAWGGIPYAPTQTNVGNKHLNCYFTLAVYRPSSEGYKRRESSCAAVYGVMLDDLGTKALPLTRLVDCLPTFVIETSSGNYQATYLFDEPQVDLSRVKALNESLVEANLCDPGAKSPSTRWGRLPFASNGKLDPAFTCRLVEWHPERRYSIEQIVDGLQLANVCKRRSATNAHKCERTESIFTPQSSENEVVIALKNRGLYKKPLGSGKHDVSCPWVNEHTDYIDQGTAYFEPSDLYPIGGFKCQHSHGDKYRIRALLEYLNVSMQAAKNKPIIRIEAGELDRVVDSAEIALAATGRYYQRGGQLVCISTQFGFTETQIAPLSQPALLRALAGAASWVRYNSRAQDWMACDPSDRYVRVLYDAEHYRHLPILNGIARQPYLRPDGTIAQESGYDQKTRFFGAFDASEFNIPVRPSREQAFAALSELRLLLSEFAFASENDEAAAISAILTAAIRPSLSSAPMYHIKASQISSGKSYLTSLVAALAGPGPSSAIAFPNSEEECQKLLLSTLLPSPAVIVFDNLTADLAPYKTLCSALTEEFLTGRVLGLTKTVTVGTRTLFLSSGNNVSPTRDMCRRCITITLDPKVENPSIRTFAADPLATVRQRRGHYVSMAFVLVASWISSGVQSSSCSPIASYRGWSEFVRQPLLWLGLPDPAITMIRQIEKDPDQELLGRLLISWGECFGNSPTMIRDAVAMADHALTEPGRSLREALFEIAEERGVINRRRLGRWIARHQGQIIDGKRFERSSGSTFVERWMCKWVT